MRLVDAQLFPHHNCVLIFGSDLSEFDVPDRSLNARGLEFEAASSSSDYMSPVIIALADASCNEQRSRQCMVTSRLWLVVGLYDVSTNA